LGYLLPFTTILVVFNSLQHPVINNNKKCEERRRKKKEEAGGGGGRRRMGLDFDKKTLLVYFVHKMDLV
jgi:hypothetical protein